MSKQLSVASAFSIFALSALALLGPGSARVSELGSDTGATTGIVAIALQAIVEFSLQMPGNAAFFVVLLAIAMHAAAFKVRTHDVEVV